MKILFMCVANSARSQMAEGLAKKILGSQVEVQSAGSNPGKVNPYARQAMQEIGIDISQQHSKSVDSLMPGFKDNLNFVITLCAEEVCPVILAPHAQKIHWPFPDPVTSESLSEDEILKRFRDVRDAISQKLADFKKERNL